MGIEPNPQSPYFILLKNVYLTGYKNKISVIFYGLNNNKLKLMIY